MMTNNHFSINSKVVAYLRESGGEEQDLSISQQENQIRSWCEANEIILTQIFIDAARPGSSADKRDAFQEMIGHFHDPNCQEKGVIVWSLSRFARNQNDSQFYKADLRRRGYVVYSLNDNIPDTSDGRVFEALIDWANEKFLETLSNDIKRGLHHMVKEYGAVPGTPPFGFKKEEKVIGIRRDNTPHTVSTWVIDEEMAPVIRAAFLLRSQNVPIKEINDKYHIFKNRSSFSTMFKNRLYIGELHYGGLVIQKYCESLVPLDVFEKVQLINAENSRENHPTRGQDNPSHPRRVGGNFMLSGILYCRKCGCIMKGQVVHFKGDKPFNYYLCTGHTQMMVCDAPRIPQKALENAIIGTLGDFIRDPNMLTNREAMHAESAEEKRQEMLGRLKILQKMISEAQRRISNLTDKLADDPNAPTSLIEKIRELESEVAKHQAEYDRINSLTKTENVRARTLAEVRDLSAKLMQILASDDPVERRTIIQLLVNRIEAERDGNLIRGVAYFYDEAVPEEAPPNPKVLMPT